MTKSSYILLIGIAIMIIIGAAVWQSTGGNTNSLPTSNPVATPIATVSSTINATGTVIAAPSSTTRANPVPSAGVY
ncbi:MAG TPA: hypothetical protein VMU07_02540 [Candidatus Paceibacterota bacterium]|nr:hypothetical protein [Candidatus Paceibacterota bacterium]